MALFQQMQDNNRIDQKKADPDPGKKKGDFRQWNSRMMGEYCSNCANMHMVTWLDKHGNEAYHLEKWKNQIELKYCTNMVKHPEYASKYFDVLTWWKVEGSKRFKELSLAANIFLGKPAHNGFKERVFSWGVYLDGKLKKRLKEENFKMSVLNSFNEKRVSDIKDVLEKRENRESTGWLTNKHSKED
jgi:hAT family C-terminal dimerisation region